MQPIRIYVNGDLMTYKPGTHQGGDWLAPIRHGYDPFAALELRSYMNLLLEWGFFFTGEVDRDGALVRECVGAWNQRKKSHQRKFDK
jgi:hypothetical protein